MSPAAPARRPPKVVTFAATDLVEARMTTSEGEILCRLFAEDKHVHVY